MQNSINPYVYIYIYIYIFYMEFILWVVAVVVINYCFTSLFSTDGHLSGIIIQ